MITILEDSYFATCYKMCPQTNSSLSLSRQQNPPLLRLAKQNGGSDFRLVCGFGPPLTGGRGSRREVIDI
jgi:hypothetical protein